MIRHRDKHASPQFHGPPGLRPNQINNGDRFRHLPNQFLIGRIRFTRTIQLNDDRLRRRQNRAGQHFFLNTSAARFADRAGHHHARPTGNFQPLYFGRECVWIFAARQIRAADHHATEQLFKRCGKSGRTKAVKRESTAWLAIAKRFVDEEAITAAGFFGDRHRRPPDRQIDAEATDIHRFIAQYQPQSQSLLVSCQCSQPHGDRQQATKHRLHQDATPMCQKP